MRSVKAFLVGLALATAVSLVAQQPSTIQPSFAFGQFTDGTAAAPAIAFASEPALGLRRTAAQTAYFGDNTSATILGIGPASNTHGLMLQSGGSTSGATLASLSQVGWTSNSEQNAVDTAITRAAAGQLTYTTVAFAALATPANGTVALCSDCAPTTAATCPATKASCICTSGGVGSLAVRANSLWYCPF